MGVSDLENSLDHVSKQVPGIISNQWGFILGSFILSFNKYLLRT